ncbi:D-alanyl-lipoteichoic acid biosynthesis protein DltB [Peptostreptococcus canis]|uniref:Teichoic acid D-alanyltransferase n=1 Tax=Peptostreptococcus canis TaxID=1159213 RepID=A0ABR6TK65_9FIRM|nr:D-alanyl-lipoteichoic acid biosynthesis protein DltB [Peptostreptococcus canis]MBC2575803.1 D-alanyl-lipoteichoic acid biosynthesis protein DltB [Peptostreptococcus canis]MBP1998082.1 membrane protein involved in D-alanine export [Peptostreptococcus canis]
MILSQYGDYLYLYILLLVSIPAVILGIREKNIKYYAMFITVVMVILTIGVDSQFRYLLGFIFWEMILIYTFYRLRTKNKLIFRIYIILSLLPLIINKLMPFLKLDLVGFVGISYMSFKTVQIIIDIFDGNVKELDFFDIIYFILFFPTLSSGPIDRYRRFKDDINSSISSDDYIENYLSIGIKKLFKGIVYKFAFASILYVFMDKIPNDKSALSLIMYMYLYTFYLFFDFAGYSSMAIGTGYIFGVHVPENFNKPFISKDMKEFWTRWHISLSRWFGDYIFSRYVLAAMRNRKIKKKKNIYRIGQIITMTTMGIWHGLTWYYIAYGVYQGIALVLTDNYIGTKWHKKNAKNKIYQYLQVFITFHIICFGMLIFSGYLNRFFG